MDRRQRKDFKANIAQIIAYNSSTPAMGATEIMRMLDKQNKRDKLTARLDELDLAGNHWWNCDGTNCEFTPSAEGCGYDEQRRNALNMALERTNQ